MPVEFHITLLRTTIFGADFAPTEHKGISGGAGKSGLLANLFRASKLSGKQVARKVVEYCAEYRCVGNPRLEGSFDWAAPSNKDSELAKLNKSPQKRAYGRSPQAPRRLLKGELSMVFVAVNTLRRRHDVLSTRA
ncbi:unnamed protein product [Calicophoron daubneyi]|uniref:Uncharacterized protein n=1 Tax=Calicophoron daubneyi TaxID=300641 RepID=A0AAV2TF64_CALDB